MFFYCSEYYLKRACIFQNYVAYYTSSLYENLRVAFTPFQQIKKEYFRYTPNSHDIMLIVPAMRPLHQRSFNQL